MACLCFLICLILQKTQFKHHRLHTVGARSTIKFWFHYSVILHSADCTSYFRRHTNRRGRSPSPGPDVGAAACWKMRSAACSPGYILQSGSTQGLVYQVAYGGPRTIKTGWTAPSLPACLPACLPSWGMLGHLDNWAQWGELHPTSGQRRRQYG